MSDADENEEEKESGEVTKKSRKTTTRSSRKTSRKMETTMDETNSGTSERPEPDSENIPENQNMETGNDNIDAPMFSPFVVTPCVENPLMENRHLQSQ